MTIPNRQLRDISRAVHLIAGVAFALFLYSPAVDAELLQTTMQVVAFPAMVITGLVMWQMPRARRWLRRDARRGALRRTS